MAPGGVHRQKLLWAAGLVGLALVLRLGWVLAVPTVPVSDFAMYRESANYLSEFGRLDPGFIYMPGFVALLAAIKDAGGDLLAQKMVGVLAGGLGAAALFALASNLVDGGAREPARRWCPCPLAAVATLAYAVWPAGVAAASVVGTDVPAAALLLVALALLVAFGPRRPWTAALAFGAAMGCAAWVRAVALPLTGLALGFWLARGERMGRALLLTAAGVAATLLVLLPWGIRHLRESGHFYFTDDHGGITALIGSNPNSEGTYTRALNRMFQDVTGRSVLAEPHHETDRAAYAIAREWMGFEPRYSLGLALSRAERLFDSEERLLYWPVFRPGVLTGRPAAWFEVHRGLVASVANLFGTALASLSLIGIAAAAVRRRWPLLALLPFQLGLTATYTLFFAEPRYRLPIEMLGFPFVAMAVGELGRLVSGIAGRSRASMRRAAPAILPGLALLVAWRVGWPAVAAAGQGLRARHRWAAIEAKVDGGGVGATRLLLCRPVSPFVGPSPVEGAPNGLHLHAGRAGAARAHLRLAGGAVPAGNYLFEAHATLEAGSVGHLALAGSDVDLPAGANVPIAVQIAHQEGPLEMDAALSGELGPSIWLDQVRITGP